jgi:hypothetical protein
MTEVVELLTRGALIGACGAALMDAWALLARRAFNVQGLDYAMLGRWIGHFDQRRPESSAGLSVKRRHFPFLTAPPAQGRRGSAQGRTQTRRRSRSPAS